MKTVRSCFITCVLAALACAALSTTIQAADPLPSWNDGAAKKSILQFVAKVTKEGSPDFVPPAERIAVFDNDGTLWAEQPMYFQAFFAFDRVKALAPQHPEWKDRQPFAAILKSDMKALLASGEKGAMEVVMATHAGMTTEEFEKIVKEWIATAKHPRFNGLLPIWSTSRCWSCSPTFERTASRRSSFPAAASSSCGRGPRRSMASRPSRSSAAASRLKFELRDGKPVLTACPKLISSMMAPASR